MLNAQLIKEKAREYGATICGIGDPAYFRGDDPQHNPYSILPKAKSIIGFGIKVPRGLYNAMEDQRQFYNYANLGVKYIDETFAEIFLFNIGRLIENEGYDACLQKSVPNLRIKGDKTTNPEVMDTYELIHAEAVEEGKPAPDVIIDFGKAAKACGIGDRGLSGKILNKTYGPYIRYCFIITDAPLKTDEPIRTPICDGCGECMKACPGKAIDENGLDTWQCSVYYKGAHKSNPFMTDDFLKGEADREAIINGDFRFDAVSARALYPKMNFLPDTQWGYSACLCGRACDYACYQHLKGDKKQ